jgi:hypothetical protein
MFMLQLTVESKGDAKKLFCRIFEISGNSGQMRGICRGVRKKCGQVVCFEK